MDLFVFASTSETQGMVLTEAMAAGKPVIALDASGAREVVRDNENGRLLPSNAAEEDFAAAIEAFADNEERAKRWAEQARQTAREFSREASARRLESAYGEVGASESEEQAEELGGWDAWLRSLKAEWDLFSEKTGAVIKAVRSDEATRADLE
jgi:glycogen synthase